MGKIERIQVPPEDRERLERLVKNRNTPQKIVWRSQIVLLAGEGIGAVEVATRVGKSVLTVRRWRRRYAAKGVGGLLKDANPRECQKFCVRGFCEGGFPLWSHREFGISGTVGQFAWPHRAVKTRSRVAARRRRGA